MRRNIRTFHMKTNQNRLLYLFILISKSLLRIRNRLQDFTTIKYILIAYFKYDPKYIHFRVGKIMVVSCAYDIGIIFSICK